MKIRLTIILLLAFVFQPALYAEDIQWETIIRINTPAKLWQLLSETQELKPALQFFSKEDRENLCRQYFDIPDYFAFNEVILLAFGHIKTEDQVVIATWLEHADGTKSFIGSPMDLTNHIHRRPSRMTDAGKVIPCPEVFAQLDPTAPLHLRFLLETAASRLGTTLKKVLMDDSRRQENRCHTNIRNLERRLQKGEINGLPEQRAPKCPLMGRYRFDAKTGKFSCDHKVESPELVGNELSGSRRSLYDIIDTLSHYSMFELKFASNTGKLTIEMVTDNKLVPKFSDHFSSYSLPRWFTGIDQLTNFSRNAGVHLLISPEIDAFLVQLTGVEPHSFVQMAPDQQFTNLLTNKIVHISFFDSLAIIGAQLPAMTLTLPIAKQDLATLKNLIISRCGELQSGKKEIYGHELEMLEMPVRPHIFNREASANQIFFFSDNDHQTTICINEKAAREKMAADCGEQPTVSLFTDIKFPVKIALACRADGLGRALLEWVNFMILIRETEECEKHLREWQNANQKTWQLLTTADSLPDEIVKLCPRQGLVMVGENGQKNIVCAVHNRGRHAIGETPRFVHAEIPTDRWLRLYMIKDGLKRRVVADFYRPTEVK